MEISITIRAEKADEATKLEYSASDKAKCTVEKFAVVSKGKVVRFIKIIPEGQEKV